MSNKIWKTMWKRNEIQFHQPIHNPLLQQYISHLKLSTNDNILVPLCGKSLDMNLLADNGYHVIGIELSKIAIQAYFDARNVKPQREKKGLFTRWWHQNIEIWCGDIFNLNDNDISHIKTVYDCASLTALPTENRAHYVQYFYEKLSQQSQILLITTESTDTRQINSASVIDSEVQALYEDHYQIELLHGQSSLRQDPEHPFAARTPMDEKVYLITNNTEKRGISPVTEIET